MKGAVSLQPSAVGPRLTRFDGPVLQHFGAGWIGTIPDHVRMRDFRQLRVWQCSHALTLDVYRATKSFPREETYGLRSQIRRAASSIGANLAEASGRQHDPDQVRLCRIAMGSACELENHLILARDLEMIDEAIWKRLAASLENVKRMLTVFIRSLTAEGRRPTAQLPTAEGRRPTAQS